MNLTFEEIYQLQKTGELEKAKYEYLSFLKQHPQHIEAMHMLAILYAEEGDLQSAVNLLKQAINIQPDNPQLQLHLSNILKNQGGVSEAEKTLLELIKKHPAFAAAYNNLGIIYHQQGNWDAAIDCYQQAIDLQNNFVDAYYNLGLAYNKLYKRMEAFHAYQAVLELSPDHVGAKFQIALILMANEQFQKAIDLLLPIASLFPFHFETQSNLGACYLRLGQLDKAKMHYLKALEITKSDLQVLFNLGVIHMQQADMLRAKEFYELALIEDADYVDAHNNLAIVYMAIKDRESALKHFCEVLRLQSDNPSVQHTIDILKQKTDVAASPPEYIQTLFDSYADHYDSHLLSSLNYQVPQLLYNIVAPYLPSKSISILDLGAGTGLSGEIFKKHANQMVGVDLSEKMLAAASQKKIYTELRHEDILRYLENCHAQFDLVVAADVIVYFGDLTMLVKKVRNVLAPHGFFIFNTEINEKSDYSLTMTGRFTHKQSYIEKLAEENGLKLIVKTTAVIRKHQDDNVQGNLFVLQKG